MFWCFFNTVMFVCACVCGAISYVNIDDLSIRCALFYSVIMCPDGCFCSCLRGVLEGSPGLYIQTQTFSNSLCCLGTQSAALFTSVRNNLWRQKRAEVAGLMKQNRIQSNRLPQSTGQSIKVLFS